MTPCLDVLRAHHRAGHGLPPAAELAAAFRAASGLRWSVADVERLAPLAWAHLEAARRPRPRREPLAPSARSMDLLHAQYGGEVSRWSAEELVEVVVGMERAAIRRAIAGLVRRGYLRREGTAYVLTERGRAAVEVQG